MAHELAHYVLGHPNYDDAHQRERDANAKGVEIMVRLGTGGDEALRRMHAVLVGTYRFQARTGKWPSLGHNPCAEIRRRIRAAASAAHRAASEGASAPPPRLGRYSRIGVERTQSLATAHPPDAELNRAWRLPGVTSAA